MGCSVTLAGIASDCLSNKGGVKAVYLANKSDVTSVDLSENVITAITMNTSAKFKKYDFRKDSATMTSTLTVGDNGGSNYISTVLSMSFNRIITQIHLNFHQLCTFFHFLMKCHNIESQLV